MFFQGLKVAGSAIQYFTGEIIAMSTSKDVLAYQ